MIDMDKDMPRKVTAEKPMVRLISIACSIGATNLSGVPSAPKWIATFSGIHGSVPNAKTTFAKQVMINKVRMILLLLFYER